MLVVDVHLLDDDERMKEAAAAAEAPPPPPEVQADGAEVWRLDGADEPYTPEAPYTPPGALWYHATASSTLRPGGGSARSRA